MSAPGFSAQIQIEAFQLEHADALVDVLAGLAEADEVSFNKETFHVRLFTRGDPSAAVLRVLDTVEAWLARRGLDSTSVDIDERSYRISAAVEPVALR